ncbi:MAG TPA: hypothetical protein VGK19_03410 [Capsulimonadaceae bacterium]|jgi:NAD kinase
MAVVEKIVVVTKKTALEELVERLNTREQARFYIEHMNEAFDEYEAAHDAYHAALSRLQGSMPDGVRVQYIERSFLPSFVFGKEDLVVTLGPDGLVVNTAKYLDCQKLLAINPDPLRMDGVLIPVRIDAAHIVLKYAVADSIPVRSITMALATMNDGQSLYALNDFFIGHRSHVSARYRITLGGLTENQSSSGVIVATGAGSTGWYRSLMTGAANIVGSVMSDTKAKAAALEVATSYEFDPEAACLKFCVREPFISRISQATLIHGEIPRGEKLAITSQMPQGGVIFSDGIEADYLEFNSGLTATVEVADRRLNLLAF